MSYDAKGFGELSIEVAEYRSTLKNYQNTYNPAIFSFTPKTAMAFPKTGVMFLL